MPIQSLWVLLGVFLYNLMALSAKVCSEHFDPFEIVFYRAFVGVIIIAIIMLYKGISFHTQYPLEHIKRCLSGTFCFVFEIFALENLPLGIAQSIDYSSPLIFTAFFIIGSMNSKTKIQIPVVIALLVGFVGGLCIIKPSTQGITYVGVIYGVMAAFLGACTSWFLHDLGRHNESSLRTVFYFMLSGVLIGLVKLILFPSSIHAISMEFALPLIGVICFGLLAQIIWTYAWSRGHPLLNSVFQFVGIFYGILLGIVFFAETFDVTTIFGMVLIFIAGVFSSIYLKRVR